MSGPMPFCFSEPERTESRCLLLCLGIQAQRSQETCPKSHSQELVKLEVSLRLRRCQSLGSKALGTMAPLGLSG